MSRKLGMDTERVIALSAQLTAQVGRLDVVAAQVDEVAWASLNPVSYAIQPGGLVIAPWAIVGTQLAAARVRQAADDAAALASSLIVQVLQQQAASAAAGSSPFSAPSVRGMVVDAVLRYPTVRGSMPAGQVAAWWASLDESDEARLIEKHPLLIGNTEGIAYADRDRANRLALKAMLADDAITGGQREALLTVREALGVGAGVSKQLIILEFPDGTVPRAAIAFGNLDDADYVGVVVPGRDNTVAKDMINLAKASYNLYLDQSNVLRHLERDVGGSHSVVAWMGYQTPGGLADPGVFLDDLAIEGGDHLTRTLAGVQAVHSNAQHDSRITVFAHSYGSRAAASSLSGGGSADSFVMFGSAGLEDDITSAAQLNVPTGQVYSTEAHGDGVADIGRNFSGSGRLDPHTDTNFGAKPFGSEGNGNLAGTDGHGMLLSDASGGRENGYMDRGTESLRNMALIGVGRGDQISGAIAGGNGGGGGL